MADVDGGGLYFVSEIDNDKMDAAIQETMRRVQGFSDAVAGSGDVFDTTAQRMLDGARNMLQQIGAACDTHEREIAGLEAKYDELGRQMSDAFLNGRDAEYNAIGRTRQVVAGEIRTRKQVLAQLREQSNALEAECEKMDKSKQETEKLANAHETLRTKIRNLKEQMADMVANGVDENSRAYKELVEELGRLQDIQGDIQTQGRALANDQAAFAGVMSGLQGVVGGFSAAQGAVALFAGENENLQKIMLKVQSLMSITMGLQQVSQTLNKDSAFSLVTLAKAKEWWNSLLDVGRGKQIAETGATAANTASQVAHAAARGADAAATAADTAATQANTAARGKNAIATGASAVAQGAQTASAVAGTAANIGLAGAFRMVGAAIMSIPVFGWVLAGITALIALVSHFVGKANEAKKAQEEWYKSVAENVYKPVGSIMELKSKWDELGDDFQEKEKFIKDNKKAFEELGLSVQGVTDAENILSSPSQVKKFVDAQIKKAEAMIYVQQAQEKVKELMEGRQKERAMSDTKTMSISVQGAKSTFQVRNTEKEQLKAANDALEKEIRDGFKNAANAEQEGVSILKNAGMEAAKEYAEGTLGAIEDAIRQKQEALKSMTSNEEYKKGIEEIGQLQAQADKITGNKSGGSPSSKKDAFLEKLDRYKAEYAHFQKWANSGDKILVQSANKEFASLLQQGATYIDYLKNQRDIILSVDIESRTKEQNKQLRQLNDTIAEETKKTVLEAFNNELSEQLTNAKTVLEMLKVIEAKRKELANDGTDVDNSKKDALDNAEKSAKEQMQAQTDELMEEYASFVAKKRKLEEQFNADVALLNKRRAEAATDAERAEIDKAIANRTRKFERDNTTSGSSDYDKMLADYGTFEQRKQQIIDAYAQKRKIAEEMGNEAMIAALDKAKAQALSKFALDELKASPDWELMFGDLDEVTTRKLEELIAKISGLDGAYLGIEFDPKDLEALKDKIVAMREEIQSRNPFKALVQGVKEFALATDREEKKKTLKNTAESAAGSVDLLKGSFDAVVGGIEKMGIAMDEETQAIIGDIGGIMDGAKQMSQGIATGNPLSVIQGGIGLLSSTFDLFNSRDRKAEKRIKAHKKALDQLRSAYTQLSWEIEKALGGSVYQGQKEAIRNMEEQQRHLREMAEDEAGKKKTDWDKVQEYKDQVAELDRNIKDVYVSISKDILQTDAKDFAGTLGDALVEAFKKGEDASKAFESTVNDVLRNAIVNQLKKDFLEKQLDSALENLQNQMGYWDGDIFKFDGLTDVEMDNFRRRVQKFSANFNNALGVYKDLFKDMADDTDTSLTGAVKGVTEETASIVAGQLNAVRINQLDATAVLRQSLQALNSIAMNTQYNRYLTKIDRVIALLERSNNDSSLRSQGLT